MTKPEPSDYECEISCWCKPKDLPEDVSEWPVSIWMSRIISSYTDTDGNYVKAEPVLPCPQCGTKDQINRISFPLEKWGY